MRCLKSDDRCVSQHQNPKEQPRVVVDDVGPEHRHSPVSDPFCRLRDCARMPERGRAQLEMVRARVLRKDKPKCARSCSARSEARAASASRAARQLGSRAGGQAGGATWPPCHCVDPLRLHHVTRHLAKCPSPMQEDISKMIIKLELLVGERLLNQMAVGK